jgi:ribosomal-protein-alanine N-acetyltransferase
MASQIKTRWITRRDLPEIMAIEKAAFSDPWVGSDFVEWLSDPGVVGIVATEGKHIEGYAVLGLHKRSVDIINFAVSPSRRRQGVGRILMARVAKYLDRGKRVVIVAEVKETNLEAQLFLRACGFIAGPISKSRFRNGEDSYKFTLRQGWIE